MKRDEQNKEASEAFFASRPTSRAWSAGAPRSKVDVLAAKALAGGSLITTGTLLPTRDTVVLLSAENNEADGKISTTSGSGNKKNHSLVHYGCVTNGCSYRERWSLQFSSRSWLCGLCVPHSCAGDAVVTPKCGSTCFTVHMLAPVILEMVKVDRKAKTKLLALELSKILRREVPAALTHRVREAAILLKNGDPQENLFRMPMHLAALRELGWHADLATRTSAEQHKEHVIISKEKTKKENKTLSAAEKVKWNERTANLPVLDPACKYVYGYTLAPPTSIDLLQNTHSVASADMTHAKPSSRAPGNLATVSGKDANKHLYPIMHARVIDNESKRSWELLFRHIRARYAGDAENAAFDTPDRRVLMDGDKGGKEAYAETHPLGKSVMCSFHRVKTLATTSSAKGGGTRTKDAYLGALEAPTQDRIDEALATATPKGRELIGTVPAHNQLLLTAGAMHGEKTSSGTESLNEANMAAREARFAESVGVLADLEKGRYDRIKAVAKAHDARLPPKVVVELLDLRTRAARIAGVRFLNGGAKSIADVACLTNPQSSHRVELNAQPGSAAVCACGVPLITGKPCVHAVKGADAGGVIDIVDKYDVHDRTESWKRCYEDELMVPSVAAIDAQFAKYDSTLRYPPMTRVPRGRPSTKRKRGVLSATKSRKRRFRCQQCGQRGHTMRTCKNIEIPLPNMAAFGD